MSFRHIVLSLAVSAFVQAAAAQVWPASFASQPGNAVMNAPFTASAGHATTTTRMMVVMAPSSLPFGTGTTLTRLAFRRDRSYSNQGYGAVTGNLRVRVGPALVAPHQVNDVRFDRLWDGVPTEVYSNGNFTVPAAGAPGSSLPSFDVQINFTRNHVWQGGPLAIEVLFTPASGSSQWRVDAYSINAPRSGTSRLLGGGCLGSNGHRPFHYVLPETTLLGGVLMTQVEGLLATQAIAVHMLAFQTPLAPVDLGSLGVGPSGCLLRIDPVLQFPVPTTLASAGFRRALSQVQLPAQPSAVGARLYSQWLCFDPGVPAPLPLSLSDGLEITLGQVQSSAWVPAARTIWKYGATGYAGDSGKMVRDEYAPILRFN